MQNFNLTQINSTIEHKRTGAKFIFKGFTSNLFGVKYIKLLNPKNNNIEHYLFNDAHKYFALITN